MNETEKALIMIFIRQKKTYSTHEK